MTKNTMKEIIIVVLLCLAIILIFGVILYDYVPAHKEIPAEIAYSTPKDVADELKSADGVDEDKVILTYKIDSTDLTNYQRVHDYKPGKTNPFSTYKTENVENTTTNANDTTQNSSRQTITVDTTNNSATVNNNTSNTTTTNNTYSTPSNSGTSSSTSPVSIITNGNKSTSGTTSTTNTTSASTTNTTSTPTTTTTNSTTDQVTVNPGNYTQKKGLK